MELRNIDRIAPLTGHVLNAEEVVGLENAMLMTKLNEQLNNDLKFWGKVFGKANDYLVVQYVNKYAKFPAFPSKKYYFCTTADFTLRALDSIAEKKEHKAKAAELLGHFEGDPGFYKYSEEVEEDEVDPATEDEEGNPLPPKQDNKFREVHRLAYIVELIDHDCFIAPRGAYVLDATKRAIENTSFQGLGYTEAIARRSYVHVRDPENPIGIAMMKKSGIVFSSDFMDSIANDKPEEMWVAIHNNSATQAYLRNLYWEGFHFYSVLDSAEYGSVYFGLGVPNHGIAFML